MPVPQPKFTLPTIEERYAKGPPTRGAQDQRTRLTSEELEYIVFRMYRGVSPPRIARELGVGASTVRDVRWDFGRCQSLLLRIRVFELAKAPDGKSAGRSWWKCLLCGAVDTGGPKRALRHVLDDVYPDFLAWERDPDRLSRSDAAGYLSLRRARRHMRENPTYHVAEDVLDRYLGP